MISSGTSPLHFTYGCPLSPPLSHRESRAGPISPPQQQRRQDSTAPTAGDQSQPSGRCPDQCVNQEPGRIFPVSLRFSWHNGHSSQAPAAWPAMQETFSRKRNSNERESLGANGKIWWATLGLGGISATSQLLWLLQGGKKRKVLWRM